MTVGEDVLASTFGTADIENAKHNTKIPIAMNNLFKDMPPLFFPDVTNFSLTILQIIISSFLS